MKNVFTLDTNRLISLIPWSKRRFHTCKIKIDDPESQLRKSRNIQNSSAHNLGRVNRSQVKLMRVEQVIAVEWGKKKKKTGSVKQDTTQ